MPRGLQPSEVSLGASVGRMGGHLWGRTWRTVTDLAGFTTTEGKVHRFLQEVRGKAEFSEEGRAAGWNEGRALCTGIVRAERVAADFPDQELGSFLLASLCCPQISFRRQASHWVLDSTGTSVHVGCTSPDGTHSELFCLLCPGCPSPSDQGLCVRMPALERKGHSWPVSLPHPLSRLLSPRFP